MPLVHNLWYTVVGHASLRAGNREERSAMLRVHIEAPDNNERIIHATNALVRRALETAREVGRNPDGVQVHVLSMTPHPEWMPTALMEITGEAFRKRGDEDAGWSLCELLACPNEEIASWAATLFEKVNADHYLEREELCMAAVEFMIDQLRPHLLEQDAIRTLNLHQRRALNASVTAYMTEDFKNRE